MVIKFYIKIIRQYWTHLRDIHINDEQRLLSHKVTDNVRF